MDYVRRCFEDKKINSKVLSPLNYSGIFVLMTNKQIILNYRVKRFNN